MSPFNEENIYTHPRKESLTESILTGVCMLGVIALALAVVAMFAAPLA